MFELIISEYYDLEMNLLPFGEAECPQCRSKIFEKPKNLQTMVNLAEKLSKNFPFVRVDFYNINGVIYFGELTFSPGNGFDYNRLHSTNVMFGNMLHLDRIQK